jgi:putative hydrolase of the HAD superfamily
MQAMPPCLTPIDESVQLVQDLKNSQNKLYILSNMHISTINYLENKYSFWDLFDGKVISCRINKVKPEYDIYQHLLNSYQLIISDTVFIDDMDINLKAAADLGIRTIKFENPAQCRSELVNLGCFS